MSTVRSRRPPPPLVPVSVTGVERRTPRLVRVTLAGPGLRSWPPVAPAASARLLVPRPGATVLELPTWTGNEYLYDDGTRPPIRTVTPLAAGVGSGDVAVEIVLHGDGPLSAWAGAAELGASAALSGPGRGYLPDPAAGSFLLIGDESAMPAIGQLIPALPSDVPVAVLLEVTTAEARVPLPTRPDLAVTWLDQPPDQPPGSTLVTALTAIDLAPDVRVWAAGEAAAMQRIRRHLFEARQLPRPQAVVRGYWKFGRGGDDELD